ncbi:MAG TPA: DUF222 domain-containing protein, partial [Myxococcota bacterium]|nr:DUF222 domain-containing protein [Myxococcota bacterium]
LEEFDEVSRQIRLLEAKRLDLVAELDQKGIAVLAGYRKTPRLLVDAIRVAPAVANRMVARAQAVAESPTLTGHLRPAPLPTVRQALHEGLIDGEHIDAITKTFQHLPADLDAETRELVESNLGETARTEGPATLLRHGNTFVQRLNPDGDEPKDAAQPANSLVFRRHVNGTMSFRGHLAAPTAELFEQLLDKGATPSDLDHRTVEERYGDAFADLVHRAADPQGGARAQLVVSMDYNALLEGLGPAATLGNGRPLTPEQVRLAACDADLIPMVFRGESIPLEMGRSRRLVKPSQRKALIARDKGCAHPSCTAPARWADAHHIKPWAEGGLTNLANLVLLCRKHHTLQHESEWVVRMADDGLPEFIPPTWMDPLQRPRRNTIHRLQL